LRVKMKKAARILRREGVGALVKKCYEKALKK